jgi:hypothetical protein
VSAAEPVPNVVEAGPHHRTWQSVAVAVDEAGQFLTTTNEYVELATGLNRWDD